MLHEGSTLMLQCMACTREQSWVSFPPWLLHCVQPATAGLPTSVKVDAYKQVKPGVWEWWSSYILQLNTERQPEEIASASGDGAAAGKEPAGGPCAAASLRAADENSPRQASSSSRCDANDEGAGGRSKAAVKGKRFRLLPLAEGQLRALPAVGKLSVLFGGFTCEAQLSLPASDTR